MAKVGMVGIGLMGHGIASNLVKHGHALTVLEHPGNQPLDALKAAGAVSVASGAELAAQSDVIILCVTGSPQVGKRFVDIAQIQRRGQFGVAQHSLESKSIIGRVHGFSSCPAWRGRSNYRSSRL